MSRDRATAFIESAERTLSSFFLWVNRWQFVLLLGLSALVVLPRLGQTSLQDWDEAIYAQVSKEIVQSNDWLTLRHGYEPYFEKPPLLMWTTALFFHLFEINEFWARFTSAISGIGLVIVTYLVGKRVYDKWTGFLAALILLSSYEFIKRARQGTHEIMLALFVLLAIYAYLRLEESRRWWYVLWLSFALAFMTKSWAALIVPPAIAMALILDRQLTFVRSRHFWFGMLLATVVVVPWHVGVYLANGREFVNIYILKNLFSRTTTSLAGHTGGPYFYLDILRQFFAPWFYLMPFGLALAFRENLRGQTSSRVLLILFLLVFGLYTFVVGTKLAWYILPVYPLLALFIASVFTRALNATNSMAFGGVIFAVLVTTMLSPRKLLYLFLLSGVVIICAGVLRLVKSKWLYQLAAIAGFFFIMGVSVLSAVRWNARLALQPLYNIGESPVSKIAKIAGEGSTRTREPLIGVSLKADYDTDYAVEGPAALFYGSRPVNVVLTMDDVADYVREVERQDILVAERYLDELSQNYEIDVLAEVDPLVYGTIRRREDR